jgi:cell shape-determining protein MreC
MNPWDDLKDLEKQIAELEETVRSMHQRIGDRDDSPNDPEELATHLTEIEEQEAVLGTLRERADALRERQGG